MNRITKDEFVRLVSKYRSGMYRMSYSLLKNQADAEDAVSEAILKAYENLEQLKKPSKFKAWMMQIVVNTSKTMLELKDEFREVLVLFYYDCFTVKEISRILGIPEGTVKSRLSRGRECMKKEISFTR
ncbi:MAG: sigma factor-like helix-turn-helix DNA-binding protein [Clostridiales bacterium]|nr:sigma factor-like helix-turn-helix DNA-binding protein [Clostridiales bacterium]